MKKAGRLLGHFLLGIFASVFLAGIVSAADNPVSNAITSIANLFSGNYTTFGDFLKALFVPEILFGVLIFLIVYAIVEFLPFIKDRGNGLKVAISIVIAILAGGFVDKNIYIGIINQYEIVGVIISFYIPFLLLFYFMKNFIPNSKLLQRIIWIGYAVLIIIADWSNADKIAASSSASAIKVLYWIIGIAAAAMAVAYSWITSKLWAEELKEATNIARNEEIEEANLNYRKILDLMQHAQTIEERDKLQKRLDKIRSNISKMEKTKI